MLPSNCEKSFMINSNGKYQILLSRNEGMLSISFSNKLFEDDGMLWLPMFTEEKDYLESQPEEVCEPRVLLLVHKKEIEEQCSSIVSEESVTENEFMPEIKLNYCENTMIIYEDKDEPSFCNERSFRNDNSRIEEENITTRKSEIESINNENIKNDEKLVEMAGIFQEHINTHKQMTDKILQEAENKDREIASAFNEILHLKNKLQKIEVENNYLKALNSQYLGLQANDLLKELKFYKEKISEFERKPFEEHKENSVFLGNSYCEKSNLEKMLKNQCELLNIQELIKDDEEVYIYGNKKLNLSLKNGKLMCRIGNIYKEFKQYIEENSGENKPIAYNLPSKSPYRKNLGESNNSLETPKFLTKSSDATNIAKETQTSKYSSSTIFALFLLSNYASTNIRVSCIRRRFSFRIHR